MSNPFSYTLRSIAADSPRRTVIVASVGCAGLALWGLWFFSAEVTLYAASREARLEVAQAASPLTSERDGVVVAVNARAGDAVRAGDVLVELKIDGDLIDVDGARSAQDGVSIALEARKQALAARTEAFGSELRALRAASSSASSALQAAEISARQAAEDADRAAQLFDARVVGAAERDAAASAARMQAAEVSDLAARARTAAEALAQREDEQQAELADFQGEIDRLQSELEVAWASLSRRELQVERAQIRAPVDGVLGSLDGLSVGSPVLEGQTIGAVVPEGELKVVAAFAPADAVGRLRPGQRARLHLSGFPWTQYGAVEATVSAVAGEVRDGLVRVELDPVADPGSALPLQHALPVEVEVAVEQLSPATLALRLAGELVTADAPRRP